MHLRFLTGIIYVSVIPYWQKLHISWMLLTIVDPSLFHILDGALMYLTFTQPDIVFAVHQIYLFLHHPREPHMPTLKHILHYIRGTLYHSFQLHVYLSSDLRAYSDVNWGGCPVSRHSTSRYCVFLGDNLISWSFKRQGVIYRSNVEVEYCITANVVVETC